MLADDGDCLVDPGALGSGQLGDIALDRADEPPDPGDLFLGGGGVGTRPVVDAVDGGGQPFPGAQQVVPAGGQVREVGDVGAEVSQPAQRNRTGQAPPPAATLDGSEQRP